MSKLFLLIGFCVITSVVFYATGSHKLITTNKISNSTVQDSSLINPTNNIPETGLLTNVEDSGYPFATLTIEFPERNMIEYFTINMEAVRNGSMKELNDYVGKYIKFTYDSELSHTLLDIFFEGFSVFGSEIAPEGEGIKAIEGVFYGAENITEGDLPGVVSVFAEDGENIYFPYFVTQEMVEVNEKVVTVFYEVRTVNTITSISLAK